MTETPTNSLLWNDWHVIAEEAAPRPLRPLRTKLLDVPLTVRCDDGVINALRDDGIPMRREVRYGFVWACLGVPTRDIIHIPEAQDDWRCIVTGGAFGVHASSPRVVENFLDLGHLPYVHQGYLGAEEYGKVAPYQVRDLPEGGIIATGCKVYQPSASPAAKEGYVVDYIYKTERPLIVSLYKANPVRPGAFDAIYLFAQPVSEERTIAYTLNMFGAEGVTAKDLRCFQQLIFLQDKPILENQFPKRLPIGPRMEMPIAADKSSVAYRRWLSRIGLQYGTIGAEPLTA